MVLLEIGFRFLPPDEEIISHFLLNKMIGKHHLTHRIGEVDLLKHEPWELPALSKVESRYPEWLFFYKLNKISQGKTARITEAGYWKSTGQDRVIKEGGTVIGSKKTLVFYKGRTPTGVKTEWVIHEYRATPASIPPHAENDYVAGILMRKVPENPENATSNGGQSSSHLTASSSQSNSVGVALLEAKSPPQPQSNSMDYDYELALRAQLEEQGIFYHDLGLPQFDSLPPSSTGVANNGLVSMEEEGISLEDLGLIDNEENELPFHFDYNTTEQEMDFMSSMFSNYQDKHPIEGTGSSLLSVSDYSTLDNAENNILYDRVLSVSDGISHGHSEGYIQNRLENGFHHDDILIMDSSVDSATMTTHRINDLELFQEERSVNSRTCKSHKFVVQRHPERVQLQAKSSGKAESKDKTRVTGERGAVVEHVRNRKSIVQSSKDPKVDERGRNAKSDSNSRSNGSAGSRRKNTFNVVETSQPRCKCKPEAPLVYVGNVLVGVILVIVIIREVILQMF